MSQDGPRRDDATDLTALFAQVKRLGVSAAQRERVWERLQAPPVAPLRRRAWGKAGLVGVVAVVGLYLSSRGTRPPQYLESPDDFGDAERLHRGAPTRLAIPRFIEDAAGTVDAPGPRPPADVPIAAPTLPPVAAPEEAPQSDGEAGLVAAAVRHLQLEHDASGALRLLDVHRRKFPAGMLRFEADRLRLDALLQLGRSADALRELDEMSLANTKNADLLLERGELRAVHARCADAITDFEWLASHHPEDAVRERISWARCICAPDAASRRGLLREYVSDFPHGPHAAEAKRALEP